MQLCLKPLVSRTPSHGTTGCGGLKRFPPMGGAANGIPLCSRTDPWRTPWTRPCVVAQRRRRARVSKGNDSMASEKKMLALPCPRPRPDALPEPGGSGRTWGGAGLRNLAFLVSVLRPHPLTYIWGWSRCLDRCRRALPLSCSFLHPCWALPAPLLRLSGSHCLTLLLG